MSDKRLLMPDSVAQVTLKFRRAGVEMRNVLYLHKRQSETFVLNDGEPLDDTSADDLSGQLFEAYKSAYQGAADGSLNAYGVDWVWCQHDGDNRVLHEGEHAATPWSGTNTGHPAPNNVALCIKLGCGLGGRSNHGRFYFAGINDGLYDAGTPNQLKAGAVTDFAAHNAAFLSAVRSLDDNVDITGNGYVGRLAIVSFVTSGAYRPEAQYQEVTQVSLTDTVFDSQRRRLPGRGA